MINPKDVEETIKGTNLKNEKQPKKVTVKDAATDDDRIPRSLILMYDNKPYITKPGLEWKANRLFGVNGYSVKSELIVMDFAEKNFVCKATFIDLRSGTIRENFGHAYAGNSNSMMQKNLLHLAVTRAECRVLRMATACGYASEDEVLTLPGEQKVIEVDTRPATEEQLNVLKQLDKTMDWEETNLTHVEAAERIKSLTAKKGKRNE